MEVCQNTKLLILLKPQANTSKYFYIRKASDALTDYTRLGSSVYRHFVKCKILAIYTNNMPDGDSTRISLHRDVNKLQMKHEHA